MNAVAYYTLLYREVWRFLRLFKQTILPPVISTLLYILIFGYSLGDSIRQIQGFDYIVYILPGLAQLGLINHSYQNSATSLFVSRTERSIENLLVSPLSYLEIVTAYIFGSIMRGLAVGTATLAVSAFFVDFPMPHLPALALSWALSAAFFGSVGLITALLAESWDQISVVGNFVLMPLVYLGGTFYSINLLPEFWQKVSYINPIFYCIDTTRYAILGLSDINWVYSFSFLSIMTCISVGICVWLFKRGVKLIT